MASPDPRRPAAIAFDVNETLFSLEPVRQALRDAGLPDEALEWWFAQVLRDGFALTVLGEFRPFREIAAYQLSSMAARATLSPPSTWVEGVLHLMGSLPAHPDARPALEAARAVEGPVLALTNGSAATTAAMLTHAGLADLVAEVVSIDDVRRWKPDRAPYERAAQVAGVPPERLAMVAVHGWDLHGAGRAGLVTGWASRLERVPAPWLDPPDVVAESVDDVVEGLLGLPAPPD